VRTAVLRVDGDIHACTALQLRELVMGLAASGTVHVLADGRGRLLGLGEPGSLVDAREELRGCGGSLMQVVGTDRSCGVRITGLSDAFALHSCVLEAITADWNWQAAA
jgi:anti-sigma B factor antagonist